MRNKQINILNDYKSKIITNKIKNDIVCFCKNNNPSAL